jgi:hypothetical protein
VKVDTPPNAFTPGTVTASPGSISTAGVKINGVLGDDEEKLIYSGNFPGGQVGLSWKASVTLIGPGANRDKGVGKIKVGFIQQATITNKGVRFPNSGKTLKSSAADNKPYLDRTENQTDPFYSIRPSALLNGSVASSGTIESSDTPQFPFPLELPIAGGGRDKSPDLITSHANFTLDVAAVTTAANVQLFWQDNPSNPYWVEATATGGRTPAGVSWYFDASGTLGNARGGYVWTRIDGTTGTVGPTSWQSADGNQPQEELITPKTAWQITVAEDWIG